MSGEVEAAGDALTGGIVARAVEDATKSLAATDAGHEHGACRNCGATVTGAFCAGCGQPAHIHRSLLSLGHDILHGVFHFEGKIWRTVPELFFHPGRLTRRYIDGERAKFVSPMALFLFTVFLMFAVFSFTGGTLVDTDDKSIDTAAVTREWQSGEIEATDEKIEALQEQLDEEDLPADERAAIDKQIAELRAQRKVMEALSRGDWARLSELSKENAEARAQSDSSNSQFDLGWPALDRRLNEGLKQVSSNPNLLLYKLKISGYKYSWALVPLSIPFLWLLLFWRRDIHLYDHAIFATYSISFFMLLLILLSIAAASGVHGSIWGTALVVIPPIHVYKQLRGAYGLSRFGASVRLFLLLIAIMIVLIVFTALLLLIGVLS